MKNLKNQALFFVMLVMSFVFVPSCRAQVATDEQKVQTNDARDGVVNSTRSMTAKRAAHTATLLPNGKVLVAGGFVGDGGGLSSAEVFDPTAKTFTSAGNMTVARSGHTATLLPNGKVLISGGYNGDYLNTAEVYDPAANHFASVGQMVTPRSGHVATLLNDGKVLLAGGVGTGWTFLSDAEIFDPQTNTFAATGGMTTARESHTATLLKDGKVLITGGHKGRRANITIYTSAEIYNPQTGTFTSAGNLTVKRHKHDATLLADGRVLIIGGSDERDGDGAYRNAEIFNPTNGSFTTVKNNMNSARYKLQGTAILLPSGKVLIAGGANRAEVFDPTTKSFSFADGDLGAKKLFATATLLKDGRVLITGGYTDGNIVSANAWIYRA
ncbi:MAG TPA: kelch repeat-containing protein [Blastocatellia bacterium]|nr:kelch repeat-containing protein [Blastocatellia bacterium]